MAAGHAFFLSNRKSFHHINKLQQLSIFLILCNTISLLAYQLILGHQYAVTSLFGYGIENHFQLKDKPVKKQTNCNLDYSTNQDHDEFKDFFDYISNILFSSAPYPLHSLDTFVSSQTQIHTSIESNSPAPTQILAYSHISHNTFGPSQIQTHKHIEPDPPALTLTLTHSHTTHNMFGPSQMQTHIHIEPNQPALTQTLTHSQISHNTYGPSQTQIHTYIVSISSGSTQTHIFSHILHNTLDTTKTELLTYLVLDLQYSFIIFGSSQYLILFSFIWCVHYNKKQRAPTKELELINYLSGGNFKHR